MQTFGAVPWYDFTIAASDKEAMMKPRDSREYVMDKVLEDLTFASTYCLSDAKFTKGSALINKWVALAFKSRVCLYEGTFRKYHSREPSSDKPWQAEYNADNKFLREAAAAAKEIMDKGPYSLVTGDVKTAYRSLFTSAGLLTQEVIFGREYSKELSAFHETSWYYYSPTYGAKIAMTKKFMNTYLTTRGTPFTDIDGYQTIDFIREFDGRDARMAQTVISPTYKMKISGRERLYSPNWKVTRTGYHPIKWSIDDDADNVLSKAASWNSLPILRYAEVLLNYAEAKAELGEMDAAVWDQTIAQLRSRAGVTPVVPDKADPYMEAYFLNTVTDKWILEVRRERGIELLPRNGAALGRRHALAHGRPAHERQQPLDGHLDRQHGLHLRFHGAEHRRQRRSRTRLLHPPGRGYRTFDRHFQYGGQPDLLAQRRGEYRLGVQAHVGRKEIPASDPPDGDHPQPEPRTERASGNKQ